MDGSASGCSILREAKGGGLISFAGPSPTLFCEKDGAPAALGKRTHVARARNADRRRFLDARVAIVVDRRVPCGAWQRSRRCLTHFDNPLTCRCGAQEECFMFLAL